MGVKRPRPEEPAADGANGAASRSGAEDHWALAGDSSCGSETEDEERSEKHYMLRMGDTFDDGRYRVLRQLGKGTFGRVVEMEDTNFGQKVAVKVVRAIEKYTHEAEIEAGILRRVQRSLPDEEDFPIVRLRRTFEWRGHYCIVSNTLGPSLYMTLKAARRRFEDAERRSGGRSSGKSSGDARGRYFDLGQVSRIAGHCLRAVAHLHGIGLAHTDLKLENILHVPDGRADAVAIIDFGGATWEEDVGSSVVCTRQYRPPEVTLGIGWGREVDLWSLGCIFAELWTGELLFQTHDEIEHLALMERMQGTLPRHMLRRVTTRRLDRAVRHGALRWPEHALDRESEAHVRAQPRLRDVIIGRCAPPRSPRIPPRRRPTAARPACAGASRHPRCCTSPTSSPDCSSMTRPSASPPPTRCATRL